MLITSAICILNIIFITCYFFISEKAASVKISQILWNLFTQSLKEKKIISNIFTHWISFFGFNQRKSWQLNSQNFDCFILDLIIKMEAEQQHAWPTRNAYESVGMLPSEDVGDMFPPHFLESNPGMNAYYNQAASRAMHNYRSSHGMYQCLKLTNCIFIYFFLVQRFFYWCMFITQLMR